MNTTTKYAFTLMLLFLLLSVDLLFVAIHIVHAWTPWLDSASFSIETDRGVAETYQYIKLFWIVACLAIVVLQTRLSAFFCWLVLFAFLLLDDAAQIHEQMGYWLGVSLNLPALGVLRPDDLGEILFASVVGVIALVGVAYTFWRGDTMAKVASRDMLLFLGLLAFFGVGVDVIHVVAYFEAPQISQFLALVEDGGEMLVISGLTAYVFDMAGNGGVLRVDFLAAYRSFQQTRTTESSTG